MRVGFFHTELTRTGPGLMLRDLLAGKDPQVQAVIDVVVETRPDILVIWGLDWDLDNLGLNALISALEEAGSPLIHGFTRQPNRGIPTGFDLDGNGQSDNAEDAQSYGEFTGQNGLAVLSRWPVATGDVQDFTQMLWRDLPGALLPWPGMPDGVEAVLRLSSTAHWLVPVDTPEQGRVWLGVFSANTPVFDGPEDRNGRRNHDELLFWTRLLDGELQTRAPEGLILSGHANLDTTRGDGRREAIRTLLNHPGLQDPAPTGSEGDLTVDWKRDDLENMRLSYVLPDLTWQVIGTGVHWPAAGEPGAEAVEAASRHRLVWVDVVRAQ